MKTTTQTYKDLFESGAVQEYRITIDGITYGNDDIKGTIELSQKLFDKDTFTVGSFTVDTLKVRLVAFSENIPRRASVEFEYRYTDGETTSEWVLFFKGKVSKRTKYTEDVTSIEAQTAAANYDTFLDYFNESISEYPANARTVMELCAGHLGLTLDNPEDIINENIVEYPNELTIVGVSKEIAKNSGGNWVIIGDRLRLVKPSAGNTQNVDIDEFVPNGVAVTYAPLEAMDEDYKRNYIKDYYAHSYGAKSVTTGTIFNPITKIRMYYDDESAVEYGTDDGSTLEIDSKWATPQTVEYVHSVINGYEYIPVDSKGVYADPATELGDIIIVDNQEALVANTRWTFDGSVTVDIETPLNNEDNYDEPYNKLVEQQFKRKVSLGDSYQGVSIGRQDGIQMLLSPDGTEENAVGRWYSDLNKGQAFQTRDSANDEWFDWMYFDIPEKTYKLSLYNTSDEVDAKIEFGVGYANFGSILMNGSGESYNYTNWKANVNNDVLVPFVGLYPLEGLSTYTIWQPLVDTTSLAGYKLSFFANGEATNGPFPVLNNYTYSYKVKRVLGQQNFNVTIIEYDKDKALVREQTFNFNDSKLYETIEDVSFHANTKFMSLRYEISNVDRNNRLELSEAMFNIGKPKPYVVNADSVKIWAESQFTIQDNKIESKVSETLFTGETFVSMINQTSQEVKINANSIKLEGLTTINNKFKVNTDGSIEGTDAKFTNGTFDGILSAGTITSGGKFKINNDGSVEGTDAKFINATITGNLNAGKVGNLNVSSSGITFPNGKLKLDSANNEIAFGTMKMKHRQAPSNVGARDVIEISTSSGKIEFLSGLTYPGGQLPNTLSADAVHTRNIIGQDILAIGGMEGVSEVRISGSPLIIDAFRPRYNEEDIGTASYRYRRIYLQNQPNVSSDLRHKFAIQDIPSDLVERLSEIKPKMYLQGTKWNFGYIAQDVERALFLWATKRYGKDAKHYVDKFAMLHKDTSMLSLLYGELAVLKEQQMMNEINSLKERLDNLELHSRH